VSIGTWEKKIRNSWVKTSDGETRKLCYHCYVMSLQSGVISKNCSACVIVPPGEDKDAEKYQKKAGL
jgi:hypothetical protein